MQVLIIGAAGMVGRKLADSISADPEPGIDGLKLVDVVEPAAPAPTTAVADNSEEPDA